MHIPRVSQHGCRNPLRYMRGMRSVSAESSCSWRIDRPGAQTAMVRRPIVLRRLTLLRGADTSGCREGLRVNVRPFESMSV